MHPKLFSLGPIGIHSYGLFVLIGIAVALYVAIRNGRANGISPPVIAEMGLFMAVVGVIGARLAYVLMNLTYYVSNPEEILMIWHGGLVFLGGMLLVIPALLWYLRRRHLPFWRIGDLWAPSLAIGLAIGRIGCFMAGCCYGKPTGVKWGVVFSNPDSLAPLGIPLHPTQLYSSLAGVIIFLVLMALERRKHYEGQIFLWLLILYSTARLYLERFRGDISSTIPGTEMSLTQLLALLTLITAVLGLMFRKSWIREKQGG